MSNVRITILIKNKNSSLKIKTYLVYSIFYGRKNQGKNTVSLSKGWLVGHIFADSYTIPNGRL